MYKANKKNNFNDRPYAAYTSICDLQLVGEWIFLRCPHILQQQYKLLFLRSGSSVLVASPTYQQLPQKHPSKWKKKQT